MGDYVWASASGITPGFRRGSAGELAAAWPLLSLSPPSLRPPSLPHLQTHKNSGITLSSSQFAGLQHTYVDGDSRHGSTGRDVPRLHGGSGRGVRGAPAVVPPGPHPAGRRPPHGDGRGARDGRGRRVRGRARRRWRWRRISSTEVVGLDLRGHDRHGQGPARRAAAAAVDGGGALRRVDGRGHGGHPRRERRPGDGGDGGPRESRPPACSQRPPPLSAIRALGTSWHT